MREHLLKVREAIAKGFTKEWFARTASGALTHGTDPAACSFCIRGAVQYACDDNFSNVEDELAKFVPDSFPDYGGDSTSLLVNYNDAEETTQQDMLDLIDRALAANP